MNFEIWKSGGDELWNLNYDNLKIKNQEPKDEIWTLKFENEEPKMNFEIKNLKIRSPI